MRAYCVIFIINKIDPISDPNPNFMARVMEIIFKVYSKYI